MTNTEAADKIKAHHRSMVAELDRHVDAVAAAVRDQRDYRGAVEALNDYLTAEVFPHAQAEEDTLYASAATMPAGKLLVESMIGEHEHLRASVVAVTATSDGLEAYGSARVVAALFATHAHKENEVLLPLLLQDPATDLEQLLAGMHQQLMP